MSKPNNEPALDQLKDFSKMQIKPDTLTTANGVPIGNKLASETVGPRGIMTLQDHVYQDELAHFDRERVPERVVHAKGGGAFGYFECTKDISKYCKAVPFEKVGKKTPIAIRFSTVGGESGSADTARDPRGFAMKFYTEHGNWDLVGNNTPIFFIRDPIFFPSFIHTQKRNPQTHLKDPNMFWDFLTLRPESMHQVSFLFSDRGTPDGFRHMHGYGSHTFKLVNDKNEAVYCKFHMRTDQGVKNLPADKAGELAGSDPDYSIRDLFNAIANKNYPSWTMYLQIMTYDQAAKLSFNPFDVTKVWSQKDYPLMEVGKFTLNENPKNYFTDVEQIAFSPAHFIPGIEASPDKMLQGRLFSYSDTHRHRLGPNYLQIPVNRSKSKTTNYQRDGFMCVTDNEAGAPNYFPNSYNGPDHHSKYLAHTDQHSGDVTRFETGDDDNYSQVTTFWEKVLDEGARNRLCDNVAQHIVKADSFIQERALTVFGKIHKDYAQGVQQLLEKYKAEMAQSLEK